MEIDIINMLFIQDSMQRFRTHVGNLEHENKILMARDKEDWISGI